MGLSNFNEVLPFKNIEKYFTKAIYSRGNTYNLEL